MFYKNQTIHNPDSPRNMNAEAWSAGKSLRVGHKHVEGGRNFDKLDIRRHEEQIAHGFLEATYDERASKLHFVFKHEAGVYKQYGFGSGYIEIPLPELYIVGRLYISRDRGKYYAETGDIHLGSHYKQVLPLSNLYQSRDRHVDDAVSKSCGKNIHYTHLCDGGVLSNLIGPCDHIVTILNKIASHMTAFLLANGNDDLSLNNNDHESGVTANRIAGYLTHGSGSNNTYYKNYWYFLNTALQKHNTQEIYDILITTPTTDAVMTRLGITEDDVKETKAEHDKTTHSLRM